MANIQPRSNGSYFFTVSTGRGPDGKYGRETMTYKPEGKFTPKQLEKNVQAAYMKFEEEVKSGLYIKPDKMIISKFSDIWLQKYAEAELGEATIANHVGRINNHINPAIGLVELSKIKSIHIIDLLQSLKRKDGSEKPLSVRAKADVYLTLKNIFKYAVKWGFILRDPMDQVDKPKDKGTVKKTDNFYDEDEIRNLLLTAEKTLPHWRVFITLALAVGMRRSELLGLEWSNIDLEKGELDVRQAIVRGRSGSVIKGTKNSSSFRLVSLSSSLIKELKEYKLHWRKERFRMGDKWIEEEREWLFCNEDGTHFYPTTPTTWWNRFTSKAGVRHIRLHDLRHTAATILIARGNHAKIISERLGHSKIDTTMNIYGHALRSADRAAADSIDDLFTRTGE